MEKIQLAIIGSGPAGLTAAIYAARAGVKPVIFSGTNPGGQLMQTTIVENYPGFAEGVRGPELMQNMINQAKNMGAEMLFETIDEVDFSRRPFLIKSSEKEYKADYVIIATGAVPKKLGIKSENKFWGRGVSSCATCDGAFFKDKTVAIIGGGNVAFEDALYMTNHAKKVYLIHRREDFKAEKVTVEKARTNKKIEFLLNYEVEEVLGDQKVEGAKLKPTIDKLSTKKIKIDGMFVAIGYLPKTEIFRDQVELDAGGYIKKYSKSSTSVEGVYVAGDAEDYIYRQAITAAADGCKAAMDLINDIT